MTPWAPVWALVSLRDRMITLQTTEVPRYRQVHGCARALSKLCKLSQVRWHTPVTLALRKAEAGGWQIPAQPGELGDLERLILKIEIKKLRKSWG